MAILFDVTDEFAQAVIERARRDGSITLADLEAIVEAGLERRDAIETTDIADTLDALADMGIELDTGLTEEEDDTDFLASWRERCDVIASPSPASLGRLARAISREKQRQGPRSAAEVAAAAEKLREIRHIKSQRSFVQQIFAELGPRLRRRR